MLSDYFKIPIFGGSYAGPLLAPLIGTLVGCVFLSVAFAIFSSEYRTIGVVLVVALIMPFMYPAVLLVYLSIHFVKQVVVISEPLWCFIYICLGLVIGPIYADIFKTNYHWTYFVGGFGAGLGTWIGEFYLHKSKEFA